MFNLFKKKALKTINKLEVDKLIKEFKDFGVSDTPNELIVSLTSFPQRMYEIHYTIYSLLNQTVKPEKLLLWLAKEQFPNLEKDIPESVLALQKNGLTICWTENTYSYKKLVPTIEKYPNHTIITADDDIFYEEDWLEKLVTASKKYPEYIICHRAHKVKLTKNGVAPYKKWPKKIKNKKPSFFNFFTGVGGVLYPPKTLHSDVTNRSLFEQLAPKADDVWFWAMALLNKTKIYIVQDKIDDLKYINPERERGLTNEITLFSSNKQGGNDSQIENVINHYPQIIDILKND